MPRSRRGPGGGRRPDRARRWGRRILLAVELLVVLTALAGLALWVSIPDVSPLAAEPPGTTAFIELRRREAAVKGKKLALKWTWRSLDQVSPHLQHAVVATEDGSFWEHQGVDWHAVEQAARAGLRRGTFRRGGSTITQQLAKNLYLSPERSVLRKLREMLIAFRLERVLGKRRILELYLNVAEWGDGIFGAEAAARHYFKRSAAELTPVQAVRLAIALPNPLRRSPASSALKLRQKAAGVLRGLVTRRQLSEAALESGLVELGLAAVPEVEVDDRELDGPAAPPTEAAPTEAPPTEAPPTEAPPTETPPTETAPTGSAGSD